MIQVENKCQKIKHDISKLIRLFFNTDEPEIKLFGTHNLQAKIIIV